MACPAWVSTRSFHADWWRQPCGTSSATDWAGTLHLLCTASSRSCLSRWSIKVATYSLIVSFLTSSLLSQHQQLLHFIKTDEADQYTFLQIQNSPANTAKMLDPVGFEAAFRKTSSLLVPTPSPTPSVSPIPSVIPDVPHFERIGGAGTKTLWVSSIPDAPFAGSNSWQVVFAIMLLSTIAFIAMAWRVPVVSYHICNYLPDQANTRPAKTPLPCHHNPDHHLRNHLLLRHGNW
jgi:hypothetical protein